MFEKRADTLIYQRGAMRQDSSFGSAWKVVELSSDQFWSLSKEAHVLTDTQLQYMCYYALLAPTSHNSIPERFRVDADNQRIEIFLDRFFVLPQSDAKARQAVISIGAVLYHIRATAAFFDLACDVDYPDLSETFTHASFDDPSRYVKLATCSFCFSPPRKKQPQTLALIKARKSVRSLYDKTVQLPEVVVQSISELAGQYSPLRVQVITDKLAKQQTAKFQEQADRFMLEDPRFTHELGEWLLPNGDYSVPYAMRGTEFGFDDEYSRSIHDALSGKSRLYADQIGSFAKGGKAGIESASAVVVITSATDDPYAWLLAGQLYDELCLMLVAHSFVTAVHAALTEVDWASVVFRTTVLKTSERPLVLLRIGRPADTSALARPHAVRPNLDQVLVGHL